jgi:SAM-dependent methyltransferase
MRATLLFTRAYLTGARLHFLSTTRLHSSMASAPKFNADQARLYNLIAENHRQPTGPWLTMTEAVKEAVAKTEFPIILDLASGPGEPAATIAAALPKSNVVSTDQSPAMVDAAGAKGLSNMKAEIADMQNLSNYADNTFDAVTCCYGYMFPDDKAKAVKETFRVLKPGGVLVATVWTKLPLMVLPRIVMEGVLGCAPPPPPIDPMALSDPGLFESMLTDANFRDLQVSESTYDFNVSNDKETAFKICVMTIATKLDEINGWEKAKEIYERTHLEIGEYDSYGGFLVKDNTFKMVLAKKPV